MTDNSVEALKHKLELAEKHIAFLSDEIDKLEREAWRTFGLGKMMPDRMQVAQEYEPLERRIIHRWRVPDDEYVVSLPERFRDLSDSPEIRKRVRRKFIRAWAGVGRREFDKVWP